MDSGNVYVRCSNIQKTQSNGNDRDFPKLHEYVPVV